VFPVSSPTKTVAPTTILGLIPVGASYLWSLNGTSYSMDLEVSNPPLFTTTPSAHDRLNMTTKNNTSDPQVNTSG
jgi:hypothetical protein